MANEITLSASISFQKGGAWDGVAVRDLLVTMTGTNWIHHRQSVGTSEEALVLGDVTAGGYVLLVNRDATNYVQVKAATGATALVRLKAGECALFRLDAGATAPFVQANTGAVELETFLLED